MRRRRKQRGCLGCLLQVLLSLTVIFGVLIYTIMKLYGGSDGQEIPFWEDVPYQEVQSEEQYEPAETEIKDSVKSQYYYGLLSDSEKQIYEELLSGLLVSEDNIYVHGDSPEKINNLLKVVLMDHPEIFWCDGAVTSTSYNKTFSSETYTVVNPKYNCSEDEKTTREAEIKSVVHELLPSLQIGDDYDKILATYEYVIDSVEYDSDSTDNQNIYSVFIGKRSVCAGYSKAMQYLLEELGIPTIYVTGDTADGSSHAWNIVLCEGQYYQLDATWGDPVYQDNGEIPPQFKNISYDYMCCNDETIYKTHIADSEYPIPECNSMDCNYYVKNGIYLDTYDRSYVLTVMNDHMYRGMNPTVFKYSNSEAYEQAKDGIINELSNIVGQNFCNYYGQNEVKYYYLDQDELNKFTMYWDYP